MSGLSIGRLAKLANVSIDTIRFYEKAGLLAPNVRRPSGFRQYSDVDLRQLRFIRRGRRLGFSLDEIRALLSLDPMTAGDATVVAEQLQVIDRKIDELTTWRRGLLELTHGSKPPSTSILDCFPEQPAADRSTQVTRDLDDHE